MIFIERYFKISESHSTIKTEIVAGFTTFFTMFYIVIVNPKILMAAGIPFGPSMVATILTAFIGTLMIGLYANRPFAIAPYMGENAFIAFTVVKVLGYSWQQAMAAIFISGIVFIIITVFKVRSWIANAIPMSLKIAFTVGIGLFLTFIGLNETGIVSAGVPGAPVHVGDFTQTPILLAVLGFILIGFFMIRKIHAAIIYGIIIVTLISCIIGLNPFPEKIVSLPPSIMPIFLQMDFKGIFTIGMLPVILTVFVMAFFDTIGTLVGVSYKAGLLDKDGNLPQIERPMLCDAVSTTVASLFGTTTAGVFIESATGIQEGGRTGLTAVVVAMLFLLTLFFAPIFTMIPAYAYGPALIIVGMLMIFPIAKLNFDDLSEIIPAFVTIVLMSFTYNIGIGMTAGFLVYPLIKLLSGKINEVQKPLWILGLLSLLFFIFYPY